MYNYPKLFTTLSVKWVLIMYSFIFIFLEYSQMVINAKLFQHSNQYIEKWIMILRLLNDTMKLVNKKKGLKLKHDDRKVKF